ncbi:MAG: SulP family inorganic anion transporter [Sphingobacteriales bacterium]|nr:MAG: SulP family inorganic anion transporter [Sphingobacteriales bacterium]
MKQAEDKSSYLKKDALAGVIVFLIALPLCLGIAQASGAPLFSGVVAGIIGGIVIGALSGSQLSVVGPAAGLTAIVITAISDLGAFDIFLCAVVAAGFFQMILGFLKAGSIANYFPSSVIEGMLAGIGLTIIIKQIPEALGYERPNTENMADADDGFTFDFITQTFDHIEPGAAVIALVSLAILILWTTKPFRKIPLIPAGLVVVIVGTLINQLFKMQGNTMMLDQHHLVNLPIANSVPEFIGQFSMPNWQGFMNPKVWQTGLVIAVVASIETLLCIEATDKLDPLKRYTPTNRELKAQGIGNMISGLVGGLPVTSVIVRSSANINAGARTKRSTIIHGSLLLICAAAIPTVLNLIPKASLAAILIFTGYRLCRPAVFAHMWKGGVTQFIPFVATAVAVVSLDLLKGVGIGLLISIFYILRQNMRIPYYYQRNTFSNGELVKLTLAQEVSFLNKASIKDTLDHLTPNTTVVIDASQTEYIDFDVLDLIRDFYDNQAPEKHIKMSLVGFKETYQIPEAMAEEEAWLRFRSSGPAKQTTEGDHKDLLSQLASEKKENENNNN